jgi:hypothetical protein
MPPSSIAQRRVAGRVPEAVVDRLEAVEVVGLGLGLDAALALDPAGDVDVGAERAVRPPVRLGQRARVDLHPQRRPVAPDDVGDPASARRTGERDGSSGRPSRPLTRIGRSRRRDPRAPRG